MPRQRFLLTGTYELPFGTGPAVAQQELVRQRGVGWLEYQHRHSHPDRTLADPHHQPHRGSVQHRHHRTWRHHCAARRGGKSALRGRRRSPVEHQCIRANAGWRRDESEMRAWVYWRVPERSPCRRDCRRTFRSGSACDSVSKSTFTNVLNHTNFAPPATDISSPSTFGVLQSAQTAGQGGNRTGQLALRMDF